MYFELFIADQFFSNVNKDGADSLHYGFIIFNLFSEIITKNKIFPVLLNI
jgi:hypothetical protein